MKTCCLAVAALLLCSASASAAVEKFGDFSADLPAGWTWKRAPGLRGFMTIFDPSGENAINIRIEQDRTGTAAEILKEGFEVKIELHDGIAVARHDWGVAIAAMGGDGSYLEIDVNRPLLKKAPAIIRSMKAEPDCPELVPALEKLASKQALGFLR